MYNILAPLFLMQVIAGAFCLFDCSEELIFNVLIVSSIILAVQLCLRQLLSHTIANFDKFLPVT